MGARGRQRQGLAELIISGMCGARSLLTLKPSSQVSTTGKGSGPAWNGKASGDWPHFLATFMLGEAARTLCCLWLAPYPLVSQSSVGATRWVPRLRPAFTGKALALPAQAFLAHLDTSFLLVLCTQETGPRACVAAWEAHWEPCCLLILFLSGVWEDCNPASVFSLTIPTSH